MQARKLLLCKELVPCSPVKLIVFRNEITRLAQLLADSHALLYASAMRSGIHALFDYPNILLVDFIYNPISNNLTRIAYQETLLASVYQYVGHAQSIATTPLDEISWNSAELNFVMINAERSGSMFRHYNDSLVSSWNAVSDTMNEIVVAQSTAITIALVVVVCIAVFATIVPILVLVGERP